MPLQIEGRGPLSELLARFVCDRGVGLVLLVSLEMMVGWCTGVGRRGLRSATKRKLQLRVWTLKRLLSTKCPVDKQSAMQDLTLWTCLVDLVPLAKRPRRYHCERDCPLQYLQTRK